VALLDALTPAGTSSSDDVISPMDMSASSSFSFDLVLLPGGVRHDLMKDGRGSVAPCFCFDFDLRRLKRTAAPDCAAVVVAALVADTL
jgi:hypothetical protein